MESTKPIRLEKFNPDDLVFDYAIEGTLRDGTRFRKIPISVRRSDETTGPLWIAKDACFSFGIHKDPKYGGYVIPLIIIDKNNPTDKQRRFAEVIKEIRSACHPRPKPCFYGQKDPIMYVKLDYDKEYNDVLTDFYERKTMEDRDSTKEITMEKYIKKNCLAKVIIEISSIFVTWRANLQMRAKTIVFSDLKNRSHKVKNLNDRF